MNQEKNTLKTILRYTIPSMVSMWIFTIYTMVDGMFIGRFVGPLGLAGVNIIMPLINFTFAIGIMIAVGSSTLIAIYFGEKKINEGNRIFTLSIITLLASSILVSLFISIFIDPLILFLGGAGDIFPYAKQYLGIIILFSTCYMTGYALEVFIKIDGNPTYPTFCVIMGGIANMILDYLFVVVFKFGIKGAAIATGLSQITCSSLLIYYILFKSKKLKFIKFNFSFISYLKEVFQFMKIGFAEFLSEISMGISLFIFNFIIVKNLGDNGVSAFSVITYINFFITMTMVGFNQGVQPILSFNLGAQNFDIIKKIIKLSFIILSFMQLAFYILVNILNSSIVNIFLIDIPTIQLAEYALKLYSYSYLIAGFNIFIAGYFTAINKVKISTIITLLRGIVFVVLFLYILPKYWGANSIWLAITFTELTTLIFSVTFLKKDTLF